MNNKSGGGLWTNANGLNFEKESLRYILNNFKEAGYVIENIPELKLSDTEEMYKISKDNTIKGIIGTQNSIFKWLNIEENFITIKKNFVPTEKLKEVWSKDLEPDIVLLTFGDSTSIHIFECKYQNGSGSVDEKIQTAVFKKELWVKLFKQVIDVNTNIHYHYLLSKWFKKDPKKEKKDMWEYNYENVFEFLEKEHFLFFFNETKDWAEKTIIKIDKNGKSIKVKKAWYIEHTSNFKDKGGKPFNPIVFLDKK